MKYLSIAILCCCTVLGAEELLVNGNFERNANSWLYADYAQKPNPGTVVSDVVYWQEFKVYLAPETFSPECNTALRFFQRKNNGDGTLYIDELVDFCL